MVTINIRERPIGPGASCFIIAEAGLNHNGEASNAHRMIDIAGQAGVDAIKFQTFDPEALASPNAAKAKYQVLPSRPDESQLEMLRRLTLPSDAYRSLIDHATQLGLFLLSSPFDEGSADFLERLDLPAYKIPSGETTNLPFLAHLARKGRPLLMSTGMCALAEVREAVRTISANGDPPLALLHCVSCYPTHSQDCNLRAIGALQEVFDVPVGWSDHTLGRVASIVAVALGACIIEKHFTLSRSMSGPDHRLSLEPQELKLLVTEIREAEQTLGNSVKRAVGAESDVARAARKSLFAARDLEVGHVLESTDVVARRPGTGISPTRLASLVGRRLARSLKAGALLQESDID